MKYYNALCVSLCSKVWEHIQQLPNTVKFLTSVTAATGTGFDLTPTTSRYCYLFKNNILFSFPYSIFCFQLCDSQTTSVDASWRAFLCFLMRVSGESHCLLSCLESFPAPSHTALYWLLCNAYTPPEGNSSSSDKGNLINNRSHFYFALSLILTSLHFVSNLRRESQNFIKRRNELWNITRAWQNIWSPNKTKYNSQCTSYTVCRKLK